MQTDPINRFGLHSLVLGDEKAAKFPRTRARTLNLKLALTAAFVLFAFLVTATVLVMHGHAVPIHGLSQVSAGSSFAEVEAALGPASEEMQTPYEMQWCYESWTWCHVTISFDENGHVTEIVHDH